MPRPKKFNSLTRAFNKDKSWVKLDAANFPSQKENKGKMKKEKEKNLQCYKIISP